MNDCWYWALAYDVKGYGRAWFSGRQHKAHRLVYELLIGKIPEGLELDHLCRNRLCVNPSHLEPVSHAENVRRGKAGRHHRSKTHCVNGHEYTPENTYLRPTQLKGLRDCRKCRQIRTEKWKAKKAIADFQS